MASKTSFYNNSGVTNEQSNAIDASVSNAEASATSASNSATAAANSASSASASAATATTSKDAAVVAKDAAVVAKNAAEAAAGGVSGALAKSNNLSDLTNASTARTNLGVAIGSNVQAYSSTLQSTTAAYTSALNTKLSGIEANATADQTKSDIDALGINATSVSGYTVGKSVPSNAVFTDTNTTYSVGDGGLTQNNFTNADHTKLDGIEASADVTDTANVVAALTAGTNITIAANGTIASTASGGTSYTHPNHSGEVTSTGDGATVIASNVVDADNLKVTGNGSNTQFLRSDGDGTFTWATPVDTNTTYTVGDGALTQKNFTTALKNKLDGIEASATADQTKSDIDALGINATSVSGFTVGKSVPSNAVFTDTTYSVGDGGLTTNDFTNADHSKLNAIEANATADQTASEIRTLVESATDSNVFTDADHTKLNAIEAGANVTDTANVVAALTAGTNVSIAADGTISSTDTNTTYSVGDGGLTTNDFTNADHSKLDGIEASATADQTASEIRTLVESATDSNVFTDADHGKLNGIATSANNYTHPNHSGEVTSTADGATVIADNVVDEANLKVSNTPTNGYVLTAQSGNTGGLTWAAASGGGGGSPDLYRDNASSATTPVATGTNAIAIGTGSSSNSSNGISFGSSAISSNNSATALGINSTASGHGSLAISGATASASRSIAIGTTSGGAGSQAVTGESAVAIGGAYASGANSLAINIDNNTSTYGAKGTDGIAIGKQAKTATTSDGISIGKLSSSGNKSIALGYGTTSAGDQSVAIGNGSSTGSHTGSTAIGNGVTASTSNEVSIGSSSQDVRISETYKLPKTDGTNGQVLTTNGSGVISFATPASGGSPDLFDENYLSGTKPDASSSTNGVAIGVDAISTGTKSIAIGTGRASGTYSLAASIVNNTTSYGASNNTSIAIGAYAKSTNLYSVAIGQSSLGNYMSGVAIGRTALTTANNQVALNGTNLPVKISGVYTLPTADGTNGQVMTTNGSGAVSWATAGGGGGSSDYVHISTQTVTSATAQVEFDLSSSDYGSYYIVAHDCAFTAAPSNEYCLNFTFYQGAYNSSEPWTNRMSLNYQQGTESGSSVSSSMSWAYNLTMRSGSTPTTSTKFGFSGMIGGRTNSPVDLNGYFITGTNAAGAPRIRGIAPNTSNDMTYMLIKPSSSTFASGKFALYGLKDA